MDWADHAGRDQRYEVVPVELTSSIDRAAIVLAAICADASMSGFRYGRVMWRPTKSRVIKGITHISDGTRKDEVLAVEIVRRHAGDFVLAGYQA